MIKSIWRDRSQNLWHFLCPLCKSARRVPFRAKPGSPGQIFQISLTALIISYLTWPWLNWKGLICFVPLWIAFEAIYRWRRRAALTCPQCGFDPFLFLIEEKWAEREVKSYWKKKFEDWGIVPDQATRQTSGPPFFKKGGPDV